MPLERTENIKMHTSTNSKSYFLHSYSLGSRVVDGLCVSVILDVARHQNP